MTNSLLERYTGDVILGLQSTTAATGKRYNRISAGVGNFGIHDVTSAKIHFRIMTDAPNLALDIRSDRININGIGTITGTGFPNGVVTAPDGFTYIDRSATSGITCWSKRVGTSNTGRQPDSLTSTVPANATAAGVAGQTAYDNDYLYVCVATNIWKRLALSRW